MVHNEMYVLRDLMQQYILPVGSFIVTSSILFESARHCKRGGIDIQGAEC